MESEIQFILDAIAEYLTVAVRRSDVTSAWSGIRPLAVDPTAQDTASALRDHIVLTDDSGLVTVTGKPLHPIPFSIACMHRTVTHMHLAPPQIEIPITGS